MKRSKSGVTRVGVHRSERGWYIMVGNMAVCSHHAPAHVHPSADPGHPAHLPKLPVDPGLTWDEALRRVNALCMHLDREPTLQELLEAMR